MREWSESLQMFPEECAANYVDGRFDPAAAEARRRQKDADDLARLRGEVHTIAQKHRPEPRQAAARRA
jgi:hypothetical protein